MRKLIKQLKIGDKFKYPRDNDIYPFFELTIVETSKEEKWEGHKCARTQYPWGGFGYMWFDHNLEVETL